MLTTTRNLQLNPAYEPVLRVAQSILLTTEEVANHWRMAVGSLHNSRRLKSGPPSIKVGGVVRYRLAEILGYEIAGQRGAWTFERISLALATMPDMTPAQRKKIEAHLLSVM